MLNAFFKVCLPVSSGTYTIYDMPKQIDVEAATNQYLSALGYAEHTRCRRRHKEITLNAGEMILISHGKKGQGLYSKIVGTLQPAAAVGGQLLSDLCDVN